MYYNYYKTVQYLPIIGFIIIPILLLEPNTMEFRAVISALCMLIFGLLHLILKLDGVGVDETGIYERKYLMIMRRMQFSEVSSVTYGPTHVISYGSDSLVIHAKNGIEIVLQEMYFSRSSLKDVVLRLKKKGVIIVDAELGTLLN